MNQLHTEGIVLSRVNYGEADRIITLLTPESGKVSLVARGVRRAKSKMAGGIELFSISSFTYIKGRGDLGTLISARLELHYGNIIKHIDRVQLGYELIKMINRATEDAPEAEYFHLLTSTFAALNDASVSTKIITYWFQAQLLQLAGHEPNLRTDVNGDSLQLDKRYSFDFDAVTFTINDSGNFSSNHIKFMRLTFARSSPKMLQQVTGQESLLTTVMPVVQTMLASYIRT